MPYITDEIEIRLKDIEVAIGAPIKPILMGSGPHTRRLSELPIEMKNTHKAITKNVIQECVDWRHDQDDLSRHSEVSSKSNRQLACKFSGDVPFITLRLKVAAAILRKSASSIPIVYILSYREMELKEYAGSPKDDHFK